MTSWTSVWRHFLLVVIISSGLLVDSIKPAGALLNLRATTNTEPTFKQKPGKDFRWVRGHVRRDGVKIPSHWVYEGKPKAFQAWIPTHINSQGRQIEGHWEPIKPKRPGMHWRSGYFDKQGDWRKGRWQMGPKPYVPYHKRMRNKLSMM